MQPCVLTNPARKSLVNRKRASPLHLTHVEAVRRQYRLFAQAVDRADEEAMRAARGE